MDNITPEFVRRWMEGPPRTPVPRTYDLAKAYLAAVAEVDRLRLQLKNQGRCGALMPQIGGVEAAPVMCDLPHGHSSPVHGNHDSYWTSADR